MAKEALRIFGEWDDHSLQDAATELSTQEGIGFIAIPAGDELSEWLKQKKDDTCQRWAILYATGDKPDSTQLLQNRSTAIEQSALFRHLQLPIAEPNEGWVVWLKRQLNDWLFPDAWSSETADLQQVGSLVAIDPKDATTHFMVGNSTQLTQLLDQLDTIKRRFRLQIGGAVGERRKKVHEALKYLLDKNCKTEESKLYAEIAKALNSESKATINRTFAQVQPEGLPKVLVMGPSGAGKSFVTHYLRRRTSAKPRESLYRPYSRVVIPDYLGAEERLEYDLFGYRSGSYTGGRDEGDMGLLLNHIGGVIFMDEIGEASPALQAKLLAFMDDYQVKPRGWYGEGIFCPVLLVAATNKPIDEWAINDESTEVNDKPRFRHDLFQRFDTVIRLPGLNDRRDDLPPIIDALLQLDSVNPNQAVNAITTGAVSYLQQVDYQQGNFRQLRRLLMQGCQRAIQRQQAVILKQDIEHSSPSKA
ncbi:hypothetical protein D5085_00925 [Ectothiorhodospiraceae bacterium BW-2]|nr:hypothetical protein D5085_00925 [Ectothiorhodospiraceae bacterium BW-2]